MALLFFLVSQGCPSIPYDRGSSIEDKKLQPLLVRQMKGLYPQSFRAVHRVILKVRDREFVFEGYVLVKRPHRIRLLAKGSMGGTAFDAVYGPEKKSFILQNPAGLQSSWIKEGALRDVSALYLTSWLDKAFLVRHKSGAVGLVYERPDALREEFLFDGATHQLTDYFLARGDECLYRIEFSKALSSEESSATPKTLHITDYNLGYHLTVQVVQLEDSDLDDGLFERKP